MNNISSIIKPDNCPKSSEEIKYGACLTCEALLYRREEDEKCDGPNFLSLTVPELATWCNERMKHMPGMNATKIIAETGITKSTVYDFLSGHKTDIKMETLRPIVKFLCGGKWGNNPCGKISKAERDAYEKQIAELKNQIEEVRKSAEKEIEWRDDKINHLQTEHVRILEDLSGRVGRHQKSQEFLRGEIKRKNKIIAVFATSSGVLLLAIIAALVIDMINPEMGFFWLRGLFDGRGWNLTDFLKG